MPSGFTDTWAKAHGAALGGPCPSLSTKKPRRMAIQSGFDTYKAFSYKLGKAAVGMDPPT
eukprot:scaffold1341_cov178-Amphora_coffeaeformis.AAC.17